MKRRDFVRYGALAGGGLALDAMFSPSWSQSPRLPGATVQTSAGRVRGYLDRNVQVFKGIPYGAATAGAGRFMPPQKPQPWTGVRDAFDWGQRAPAFVGGEPDEMFRPLQDLLTDQAALAASLMSSTASSGCSTINLFTWSSWIVANTSTGLYMWLFHQDGWGLALNLSNALMCGITVAITLVKRANGRRPSARVTPADQPMPGVCPRCAAAHGEGHDVRHSGSLEPRSSSCGR